MPYEGFCLIILIDKIFVGGLAYFGLIVPAYGIYFFPSSSIHG